MCLAEGDPKAALAALRPAWTTWQELEAPYEAARVRVLVGLACRELGDRDSAELELDAARWAFRRLGAVPDLARVDALAPKPAAKGAGGLTAREVALPAAGGDRRTNGDRRRARPQREDGGPPPEQHLHQAGLSSRAAATAYAYEHDLVYRAAGALQRITHVPPGGRLASFSRTRPGHRSVGRPPPAEREDQPRPRPLPLLDFGTTPCTTRSAGSGPALLAHTAATATRANGPGVAGACRSSPSATMTFGGFSRSPARPGCTASGAASSRGRSAALLRRAGPAPALVFGHSAGPRSPAAWSRATPAVRHAVCYEPSLFAVVPGGEQIVAGMRPVIEQAMAEGGPRRAMEAFMRGGAGDEVFERWLELADPSERDRVLGNGTVLTAVDLPWLACFVPDREAMAASGVPLTVVSGSQSRDTWFTAAAAWLAEGTEADRAELPGGHAGFVTHPEAFVALVRRCGLER